MNFYARISEEVILQKEKDKKIAITILVIEKGKANSDAKCER